MSSNEIRQIVGMKPSSDPRADELRNKNLNRDKNELEEEQPLFGQNKETDVESKESIEEENSK